MHVHLGYIRFSQKTGWGPWLRGDSALGPPVYKLHFTIRIVLLSEFVSWNTWLTTIPEVKSDFPRSRAVWAIPPVKGLCKIIVFERRLCSWQLL